MKRLLAGLSAAAVVVVGTGAVWGAGAAHATPANCQDVPWGFFGSSHRTICDGPIFSDGSWNRLRIVWRAAHTNPLSCSTSGGQYSSFTTCYGGDFVPYTETSNEIYPVNPTNILPDEPAHLPIAEVLG